ncbi:SMI1/KNR4 family protein [Scopulibacillus cellulosilyticus]|uniref:SMI1/KNR4 family protein n=1 Tax=Scopulibacillus cellulosilyticus TaxID=2665665 RepID=A0ABW2PUH1_9BACL
MKKISKEKVEKIIKENKDKDAGFFTGRVDENVVKSLENELQVNLPNSYKWFLLNYGSGGLYGVDILGVEKLIENLNEAWVIETTKEYRELGLDKELIVIEDIDIVLYCLDTSQLQNGECPVVSWDQLEGYDMIEAENFYDFLFERLSSGKEAWEEEI